MSKAQKKQENTESEATEIIELAIDDIELLTRTFNTIADVCKELNNPSPRLESAPRKELLN